MAVGGEVSKDGKNLLLNRAYKTSPDYTIPSVFKVGIGTTTPLESDTDLENAVPISDGTVPDDGSNTLTGSDGGDNSTNNTTTYKEGAGQSDVTAQNLIANNTNATKTWTIADLAVAGSDAVAASRVGMWLYVKDAAALAKFKTSGTCFSMRVGSDSSNYYKIDKTAADLAVGWNWITSGTTALNGLTEVGTVSGDLDTFVLVATTNNATDTFVAGDVIYDLLRQWTDSDLVTTFVTGYPSFDETNKKVTLRYFLSSTQANGFPLTEVGSFNTDGTRIMVEHDVFTSISKSSTDEISFVVVNKIT